MSGDGGCEWVGNESLCERKNCMRLSMVVLSCTCGRLMESALQKCLGKALIKAVVRSCGERLDLKCPGSMCEISEASW